MLRLIMFFLLFPALVVNAAPFWVTESTVHHDAGFQIQKLAGGLDDGWGLAVLPDKRLLVSSRKKGIVWLLAVPDKTIRPVLRVDDLYTQGQGGLFAVWVDRDFPLQPFVYLAKATAMNRKNTTQLLRFRFTDEGLTDGQVLFTALPWVNNSGHFGGAIAQDQNGLLYLSVGDRRQQDKPQALDNHLGKIVRLTRSGDPAGKAVAEHALPEIYSYGHRNPQGLFWHDGVLWEAEHGPQGGDELNQLVFAGNYGWPVITYGEQYGGGKIGEGTAKAGMQQPAFYYVPSIATSDVLVRGKAGNRQIFIASLRAGVISQLQYDGRRWQEKQRLFASLKERWRSLKPDGAGGFYLLAESGNLYSVQPPLAVDTSILVPTG